MKTDLMVVLKMVERIKPQAQVETVLNEYVAEVAKLVDRRYGQAFVKFGTTSIGVKDQKVLFSVDGVDSSVVKKMIAFIIESWVDVTDGKGCGPNGEKKWWQFWKWFS